jgi:HK97 gp10 family phage protein
MNIKLNIKKGLNKSPIYEDLKKVLFDSMLKMQEIAVRVVPVDTGRLKNSIKLFPNMIGSNKYKLATGVNYGEFVEFGTYKQKAQPYMRPALFQVKNKWVKEYMKKYLKKEQKHL